LRFVAVDLGASSGRVMLSEYEEGQISLEEVYRFPNNPALVNGTLYWDILYLWNEIKTGLAKCARLGNIDSIGVDAWGNDFGLIDNEGQLLQNPVHYRDKRTEGFRSLYKRMSPDELYQKTGIQEMRFNAIFQLHALAKQHPKLVNYIDKILNIPDLINYFLTGVQNSEYTVASTSGLVNAQTRNWDDSVIHITGLPRRVFCDIVPPGSICGYLGEELRKELNIKACKVVCVASHDTASAVAAVPNISGSFAYISSGTWSLMGTELKQPCLSKRAQQYNFTNEGGVDNTIRFLKNIAGTWILQESKRQWSREGKEYSFEELEALGQQCEPFVSFIDVDDELFATPGNMPKRIQEYCKKTGQPVPQTVGEIVRCINESLALKYRYVLKVMEDCLERKFDSLHIVGGGAKSKELCRMTACACGIPVVAGPEEATALGNIAIQLMAGGGAENLRDIRNKISKSSDLITYQPINTEQWDAAYTRFQKII
jgi:rhamnulokinase